MIEIKKVSLSSYKTYGLNYGTNEYIEDLQAFGWQFTENVTERHGKFSGHYAILARETTMKNYHDYCKFELDYENYRSNFKHYNDMEITTVLLLLLLCVIPGVAYISYKLAQKNNVISYNVANYDCMKNIVKRSKSI